MDIAQSKPLSRIIQLKGKGKVSTIQDKKRYYITEEDAIMNALTEYCTELYNYPVNRDTAVLNFIDENEVPQLPILRLVNHPSSIVKSENSPERP